MEILSVLKLNSLNWPIKVKVFDSAISQAHNNRGLPVLAPSTRGIRLVMENKTYTDIFYEWAKEPLLKEGGEIVFYDSFQQKISHRMCFEKAACASFRLFFNKQGQPPSHYEVILSVASKNLTIELGSPEEAEEAATPVEQLAYDELYLVDDQNNGIDDVKPGMQVELVLKTTNCEGKTISIDLSSEICDYKYDNKILKDDILTYTISKSIERIPLEVIKQQPQSEN